MANVVIFLLVIILVHSTTGTINLPAIVNLRIEGADATIFEGYTITQGHDVTTASGGTHHCDGTNNNASSTPGPTPTSALDSASKWAGFTWDGGFSLSFDDYFITRIKNTAQTTTQFWGILVNCQFIQVGGCQQKVTYDDKVLFAFDAFSKVHCLVLETSSHITRIGRSVTVTVTDGVTGDPISGASVGGQTTDSNGHANINFASSGVKTLKAERSDSIRSNAIKIIVF